MFLIGYGVFRSFAEFFREPEEGFMGIMTLGISMGQWLSLPMIIAGVLMLNWAYRRERHTLSWQEPRKPDKPGRLHQISDAGEAKSQIKSLDRDFKAPFILPFAPLPFTFYVLAPFLHTYCPALRCAARDRGCRAAR